MPAAPAPTKKMPIRMTRRTSRSDAYQKKRENCLMIDFISQLGFSADILLGEKQNNLERNITTVVFTLSIF